jgi:Chorismate mutase
VTNQELVRLRNQIDAIDGKIVALLNDRAQIVDEIAGTKKRSGLSCADPERERFIISRLRTNNPGPFPDQGIEDLFHSIFRISRELERNRIDR